MVTTNENIINRKIILLKRGFSIPLLAKKLGYTPQGVLKVINGKFKSTAQSGAMLNAVAGALGVTKEEFWPEFYESPANMVSHNVKINEATGAVN
jgi:lambda repressor-like predicted transcriptional regulator